MFEKEAIRHAFEDTIGVECLVKPVEYFTYEELSDELQEKAYDFQQGAEFGYNKANEWHYPSKNELPNCDDKTLLIFIANDYYEINGETIIKKRTVLGFYKKAFINENMKLFVEKSKGYEAEHLPQAVIAWKEIIPPELEESE